MPYLIACLLSRNHDQDLPEVVTVGQLFEPASARSFTKLLEHRQRHVLLVGHSPRGIAQPPPRELSDPRVVPFSQLRCRDVLPRGMHGLNLGATASSVRAACGREAIRVIRFGGDARTRLQLSGLGKRFRSGKVYRAVDGFGVRLIRED